MLIITYIVLFALVAKLLFTKLGLPGILGMIATGILLGPILGVIDESTSHFLAETKTIALIVILIRAGLGISKKNLHRIGGAAIRMSFIPGIIEGTTVTFIAHLLLNLPILEAGMLGFIIAAVSPAVVVPSMLELKEDGFGTKKEVPTLVLAGASLDDVFAITIFGVFATLAGGTETNWGFVFRAVPLGIIGGIVIGALLGFLLSLYYKRYHIRDTVKVLLFMILAILFYGWTDLPAIKEVVPIASLFWIMAMGVVLIERNSKVAHRMAQRFNKIWVLAEILLFVFIGTEVDLKEINMNIVGIGLLILTMGLIARSIGVWLALLGSDLNNKEKLFCVIAYWPKATVQAAMGAVPLAMIASGKLPNTPYDNGQIILMMAVLSIVFTAPLGAIGIKIMGPKLLARNQD